MWKYSCRQTKGLDVYFSSDEEVREYYTKYAKEISFGVTRRSSKTDLDGKLKYFTLVCVCQGTSISTSSNILKPRAMGSFGCKDKINATVSPNRGFHLSCLVLEQTHILSFRKEKFMRCHKKLDEQIEEEVRVK